MLRPILLLRDGAGAMVRCGSDSPERDSMEVLFALFDSAYISLNYSHFQSLAHVMW